MILILFLLIGELIGFRVMGDINEHLLLERQIDTNDKTENSQVLASSVLVLMIRGLFTKLAFPYVTHWRSTGPYII